MLCQVSSNNLHLVLQKLEAISYRVKLKLRVIFNKFFLACSSRYFCMQNIFKKYCSLDLFHSSLPWLLLSEFELRVNSFSLFTYMPFITVA